jgi:4-hydroxy-tetrahydrodipicolinate synthase
MENKAVIGTEANPFGRLITAMPTPFDQKMMIDFAAVERLVNHLINNGTQSIVVSGSCGETSTLEDEEKAELLKSVVAIARKRVKIIMGAGSNSTKKAVAASREAEKLGADGLLSVVPYYNKPNQAGLLEHFSFVAKSTSLPIILYNIPGRTGINMTVETTVKLAESFPNIIGLKDCFGSTDQAAEIARLAPKQFRVYTGDDHLILPFLAIGGCGVVSTAGSLVSSSISKMIELFLKGDLVKAKELYWKCLPLFKGLFAAPNPTCLKYALSKRGMCKDYVRAPLVPLDADQRKALETILDTSPLDPLNIKAAVTVT